MLRGQSATQHTISRSCDVCEAYKCIVYAVHNGYAHLCDGCDAFKMYYACNVALGSGTHCSIRNTLRGIPQEQICAKNRLDHQVLSDHAHPAIGCTFKVCTTAINESTVLQPLLFPAIQRQL